MSDRCICVNSCSFEFKPKQDIKNVYNGFIKSDNFWFLKSECCLKVYYSWEGKERNVKVELKSQPILSEEFYLTVSLFKGNHEISFPKKLFQNPLKSYVSFSLVDLEKNLLNADRLNFGYRVLLQKGSNCNHQRSSGDRHVSGQKSPALTSQYLRENYSLEKLSEDFAELLLESDTKKDVKLRCGNVVLKADKTILRARSPWFAEKLQSRTENVIEVQFMDQATLNEIIRYIYTGKIPDLSFENAKKLYAAGSLCRIDFLTQKCVEFLMDSLTVDNACEVLAIAADEDFSDKIVSYIMKTDIPYLDEYWKPFCDQHSTLANLILNKIIREKR